MTLNLLALANSKRTDKIGLSIIFKHDILPWLISAGIFLLIFVAIKALISSANSEVNEEALMSIITSRAQVVYLAIIILAVLCARRSRSILTWVIVIILVFGFLPQSSMTIAVWLMPASVLQPMIAMVGLLAGARIVEYIRLRYVMNLDTPTLSPAATVAYSLLIVIMIITTLPLFSSVL